MIDILFLGYTKDEWISTIAEELEFDEIPLGHILQWGKEGFKLENEELETFIKENISALLKAGGVPIMTEKKEGMIRFVMNTEYGTDPQEIINNIMTEWRKKGEENYTDKNYPFTAPWFGRPDNIWKKERPLPDPEVLSD